MSSKKIKLSFPVQLALFGIFILNLAIGILHLLARLVSPRFPLWIVIPCVTAGLSIFMSWQILQLVESNQMNYGFQLGGLWLVSTFIVDFFLYILPSRETVTDIYEKLGDQLLIHYSVILAAPTVVGFIHFLRSKQQE
ncbi:MAG TPA: hypothetical protein VKA68_08240 [bacterium]|nr:hypothetical protein [bacterium]